MSHAWEARALCRLTGPEPFFAEGTCRPALAICQRCPVQAECILANYNEKEGVWGCSERCRKRIRSLIASGDYTGPEQILTLARQSNARTLGRADGEVPDALWAGLATRQLVDA
jgi:hypothetical protein